uniref:Reverse transcriptase domain-containing protein n=1 Tax=Cannabis sativa TaxID=3483 RepID=A0A803QBL1_CANSA
MGDFNDILPKEERIGKRVRFSTSTEFVDCIAHCRLEDVKFSGSFYTWCNKQFGDDRIYSKIDRVLANQQWMAVHPTAEVIFMNEHAFDHTPAVLNFRNNVIGGRKPFKYFSMWESHPGYDEIIQQQWQQHFNGTLMFRIVSKLKGIKTVLRELNKNYYSDICAQECLAKAKLDECQALLQQQPLNENLHQQEKELRANYTNVFKSYMSFLQQKAKLNWARAGDENSVFFHNSIRERRRHNQVITIVNAEGVRMEEPKAIIEAFIQYYQELLGSNVYERKMVQQKIIREGGTLTQQQMSFLLRDYKHEEVKEAIFAIPGCKAPGPDGFGSSFFQKNWSIIGAEVAEAIISLLNTGKLLREINNTTLTLVPKLKCPNTVRDYRPIACCNVIYKAATKLICSRLNCLLPQLVADNQGGFIQGRFIAHNVMICQDLIRHYGRKQTKPSCVIKLDLQKAYDTIEWNFIEEMLQ